MEAVSEMSHCLRNHTSESTFYRFQITREGKVQSQDYRISCNFGGTTAFQVRSDMQQYLCSLPRMCKTRWFRNFTLINRDRILKDFHGTMNPVIGVGDENDLVSRYDATQPVLASHESRFMVPGCNGQLAYSNVVSS